MPEFMAPLINVVYFPTTQIAKILDRPPGKHFYKPIKRSFNFITYIDQLMYLVSFIVAMLSGWILNSIKGSSSRKAFSTTMGLII
jgi:hypothetical protein